MPKKIKIGDTELEVEDNIANYIESLSNDNSKLKTEKDGAFAAGKKQAEKKFATQLSDFLGEEADGVQAKELGILVNQKVEEKIAQIQAEKEKAESSTKQSTDKEWDEKFKQYQIQNSLEMKKIKDEAKNTKLRERENSAYETIFSEAIGLKLKDEFKDKELFKTLIKQNFKIEIDESDDFKPTIKKHDDTLFMNEETGLPASLKNVAEHIKNLKPSMYYSLKEGPAIPTGSGETSNKKDYVDIDKKSPAQLINEGVKEELMPKIEQHLDAIDTV
jgi:hypothetical protein